MRRSFAVTLFLSLLLTVAPAAADSITHTVVAGDSLSTIADRFGVTVSALESRNHLTDASVLQLGQQIVVPVHVHHPAPAALPSQSLHPALQVSVALHAVHAGTSRSHSSSQSTARIAASRALWAATHVGAAGLPGDTALRAGTTRARARLPDHPDGAALPRRPLHVGRHEL